MGVFEMQMKLKRLGRWVGGLAGLCLLVVSLPLVYPKPLFAHSVVQGDLSVHADTPIPHEVGEVLLADVAGRLADSPLSTNPNPMAIYVTNTQWRWRWLWVVPPQSAGGFIANPVTRNHTFFSGANFATNSLISPSGYQTEPPRTLAYYGAHELTHVETARSVSLVRYHQMPVWVREGIADYVAMPKESSAELYTKIGEADADLEMMRAYGVYAPYRLLVTYFLDDAGWTVDELLATDMSVEEAREIVFPVLHRD